MGKVQNPRGKVIVTRGERQLFDRIPQPADRDQRSNAVNQENKEHCCETADRCDHLAFRQGRDEHTDRDQRSAQQNDPQQVPEKDVPLRACHGRKDQEIDHCDRDPDPKQRKCRQKFPPYDPI